MAVTAYLAGPDVFLPNAREHARRKVEICARRGIVGRTPLDEDSGVPRIPTPEAWLAVYRENFGMMEESDVIIANLTPFRGASADAGTLVELGWFLGRGRPLFGYSNTAVPFTARIVQQTDNIPDRVAGVAVEDYSLPDNLMIAGAVLGGGGHPMVVPHDRRDRPFEALDVFERCVRIAAAQLGCRPTRLRGEE